MYTYFCGPFFLWTLLDHKKRENCPPPSTKKQKQKQKTRYTVHTYKHMYTHAHTQTCMYTYKHTHTYMYVLLFQFTFTLYIGEIACTIVSWKGVTRPAQWVTYKGDVVRWLFMHRALYIYTKKGIGLGFTVAEVSMTLQSSSRSPGGTQHSKLWTHFVIHFTIQDFLTLVWYLATQGSKMLKEWVFVRINLPLYRRWLLFNGWVTFTRLQYMYKHCHIQIWGVASFPDLHYLQCFDGFQYVNIEGEGWGDLITCGDVM